VWIGRPDTDSLPIRKPRKSAEDAAKEHLLTATLGNYFQVTFENFLHMLDVSLLY
jgi:hypothetical protein